MKIEISLELSGLDAPAGWNVRKVGKPLYRRAEQWSGCPLRTLGEAADFLSDLGKRMVGEAPVETDVVVRSGDRQFGGMSLDDLRAQPPSLAFEDVTELSATLRSSGGNRLEVGVLLFPGGASSEPPTTHLDVLGHDRIAVDETKEWVERQIDERTKRIRRERELAEAAAKHLPPPGIGWKIWLNQPWPVAVGGGSAAAVISGVVLYVLFH